jgi:hypothetical protein
MAGDPIAQLLDCGHVGAFAGVCQYEGCATRLCPNCVAACETCGTVLCQRHQVWLDARRRVFCPAHVRGYLVSRLAARLLPGGTQ